MSSGPNEDANDFPNASEHATDQALYLDSLSAEYDSQPNIDYGDDAESLRGTNMTLDEARATVQAQLNDPNYVETDPNGCPYGCTSHKEGCDIKGNISFDTQEKIYHLPGMEFYDATTISPAYGERWFCSEDEARNNGWRKSSQ